MRLEASLVQVKKVNLSKTTSNLTILQMSDVHIGRLKVPYKKINNAINHHKADILVMTGDYIESKHHVPKFIKFIKSLDISIPMYLCLGNHDFNTFKNDPKGLNAFINQLQELNINVLNNSCCSITKNSRIYNIVGIADLKAGSPDIEKAFSLCKNNYDSNIVLSHNPDISLTLPSDKVDYLLCGHFHGGQIWTPFGLEFKLLRDDYLPKKGITRGIHQINNIKVYINRGIGNVRLPLRFFSKPEITIIYI